MKTPQLKKENFTEEMEKCIKSPCYFYNKYWKICDKDGNEIPKKELTEEEFKEQATLFGKMWNMQKRRSGYKIVSSGDIRRTDMPAWMKKEIKDARKDVTRPRLIFFAIPKNENDGNTK